jgi:DNA-binding IclR family transcriptional regulator
MANSALQSENIIKIAYPVMQEVVENSEETVALFIIRGTKRICIDKIEGLHSIRWHIEIGDSAPLGISSSGKLLLAFDSKYIIDGVLKKQLFLKNGTVVNPEKLKNELDIIRVQGYAVSFCENTSDGVGISAPIKNAVGKVIASLTILGPISRINSEKVESYKNMLISHANQISLAMGSDACTLVS